MSNVEKVHLHLNTAVFSAIAKVCRQSEAAIFTFLSAVLRVSLYKYLDADGPLLVLSYGAGRSRQGNTGLRRVDGGLSPSDGFGAVLAGMKDVMTASPAGFEEGGRSTVLIFQDPVGATAMDDERLPFDLCIEIYQGDIPGLTASFHAGEYDQRLITSVMGDIQHISGLVISKKFDILLSEIPVTGLPAVRVERGMAENEAEEPPAYMTLRGQVKDLFSEVLEMPGDIPVHTGFFEMGGNSLKSMVLLSRIFETFGARVPLQYFRRHATIGALSALLFHSNNKQSEKIVPAVKKDRYKALKKQEKLFFLQTGSSVAYNIPYAIKVSGHLDRTRLREALQKLVRRHEALRTRFEVLGDELMQVIDDDAHVQLSELPADDRSAEDIVAAFVSPFDLHVSPLFRAGISALSSGETLLLLDIHHIVADGISCMILLQDLSKLYRQEELPVPPFQFKDYSEWYHGQLHTIVFEASLDYWKERMGDRELLLRLPYDHQPAESNYQMTGKRKHFSIGSDQYQKITGLCAEMDTTSFCLLLSVYQVLLSRICAQEELVTGVIASGRQRSDFENVMGMLINTIPFKHVLTGTKSFRQLLSEVTELFMEDLDNSWFDIGDLLPNARIDTVFVVQNYHAQKSFPDGVKWQLLTQDRRVSKFNLVVIAVEMGDHFDVEIHFKHPLFSESTVETIIRYFTTILSTVLADPSVLLSDIHLLDQAIHRARQEEADFFYI